MQQWDYHLFSFINNLAQHSSTLDWFMVITAKWGAMLYGLILIGIFFKGKDIKTKRNNRKVAVKAVISAIIGLAINQLIGFIYFRPRPFATHTVNLLIDRSPDPSFPSDHATGASSLSFSVLSHNPVLGTIMSLFMLILIISRVYVGTHYPLDVVGGILTGCAGAYIIKKVWPLCDKPVTNLIALWDALSLKVTNALTHDSQQL